MCIFLTTSAHPDYPFVLVSNRDEYFRRPTSPAAFDATNPHVLCPHDLASPSHGTWIGVTKTGRLGLLVNYKEGEDDVGSDAKLSRGAIVQDFLNLELDPPLWQDDFYARYADVLPTMGGFSFLFGQLDFHKDTTRICPLQIISNRGAMSEIFLPEPGRSASGGLMTTVATEEPVVHGNKSYIGLLNLLYLSPWPKVLVGENLLTNLVISLVNETWDKDKLIKELFKLLSFNCIKTPAPIDSDDKLLYMDAVTEEMKSSIFIPPLKTKYYHDAKYKDSKYVGDYYGTRTQTVILLSKTGELTYIERTLHEDDTLKGVQEPLDDQASAVQDSKLPFDVTFNFNIFAERAKREEKKPAPEDNLKGDDEIALPTTNSGPVSVSS